ncbi:ABC transporter permease [Nocardioides lianchengensis]|uniref:Autoinducer 2 import system permease protein LsrD n=1 Tax=Nocardioides lianchengensis TaxID=1045774 RepID=A0A1G6ZQA0_9ACTN|nr:ABC transporter permease [Nocardioides lianchengensis]NYG12181.1 rhamnose transport system permease protein [Nocardioides lianchengensis]SDE04672.1 rhamnose transport system permease protein [Nocardioides lianchengensis]
MSTLTDHPETSARKTRTYAAYSRPFWQRVVFSREFAVIALLIAAIVYSRSQVDYFDGPQTMYYLFRDSASILLLALPMTAIIITGEIDLSVASTVGLTSVAFGMLHSDAGLSMTVAALLAIVIGAVCGAFNGFLIAYVGLPSIAVTIGTLALFRGIAAGLLGTESRTDFSEKWTDLAKERIIEDQPYPMILIPFVVLAIVFVLLLHFSPFGRGVFEIGLNDEAAHFTGVDVARTKAILFVLSGAVAGFVGIYTTLVTGVARAENSVGLELQVIAAVLLGGVSIFGGKGALHGVIAGVLLIGVIQRAMLLSGETINIINIVIGVLLVLSVMSTSLLAGVRRLAAASKGARSSGRTSDSAGKRSLS